MFDIRQLHADLIAATGANKFLELLMRRARSFSSDRANPASVLSVELSDEYAGFVAMPLKREDILHFFEVLATRSLGQIVPPEVLEQVLERVRASTPRSKA